VRRWQLFFCKGDASFRRFLRWRSFWLADETSGAILIDPARDGDILSRPFPQNTREWGTHTVFSCRIKKSSLSESMVELSASELPVLVEAVLVWKGKGRSAWPCRDDEALEPLA
jgi:hypothetical protein